MRMMLVALVCCSASLAACGARPVIPEPVVNVVETKIQVSMPCLEAMPEAPIFLTEFDILGPDESHDYDASFLLWEEWEKLTAYKDQLEAVLPACVKKPGTD